MQNIRVYYDYCDEHPDSAERGTPEAEAIKPAEHNPEVEEACKISQMQTIDYHHFN